MGKGRDRGEQVPGLALEFANEQLVHPAGAPPLQGQFRQARADRHQPVVEPADLPWFVVTKHECSKRVAVRRADGLGPAGPNVVVQTELYPIVGEPSVGREIFAGNHFSQVKCLGACHNMRRAERDARNGVGKGPLDRTEDRPFEIAFGPVDNCNAGYGGQAQAAQPAR